MSQFNSFLAKHSQTIFKDYQHASKTFRENGYAKAPKVGFLYYVVFNINANAVIDKTWLEKGRKEIGVLVKKADLPKFTLTAETLNQYNRKTLVHTKLTYSPVSFEFHDDNSGITHNLWQNYFKYYVADSNYGVKNDYAMSLPEEFRNNKFGTNDVSYGLYDSELEYGSGDSANFARDVNFFRSIDIYVLHLQKEFTKYTLVNPKVTEWAHDSVSYNEGNKTLQNRMSVAYETVFYQEGYLQQGVQPEGWTPVYYDNQPSPLSVGGNKQNASFGTKIPSTLGNAPDRRPAYSNSNTKSPFDEFRPPRVSTSAKKGQGNIALDIAGALATNYLNKKGLGKLGPVGYNIAQGVLGGIQGVTNPAGKYSSPPSQDRQPGVIQSPGGVGINLFKSLNTSVDGKIRANPAAVILPRR